MKYIVSGGDNLGNHIATRTLNLNFNSITDVRDFLTKNTTVYTFDYLNLPLHNPNLPPYQCRLIATGQYNDFTNGFGVIIGVANRNHQGNVMNGGNILIKSGDGSTPWYGVKGGDIYVISGRGSNGYSGSIYIRCGTNSSWNFFDPETGNVLIASAPVEGNPPYGESSILLTGKRTYWNTPREGGDIILKGGKGSNGYRSGRIFFKTYTDDTYTEHFVGAFYPKGILQLNENYGATNPQFCDSGIVMYNGGIFGLKWLRSFNNEFYFYPAVGSGIGDISSSTTPAIVFYFNPTDLSLTKIRIGGTGNTTGGQLLVRNICSPDGTQHIRLSNTSTVPNPDPISNVTQFRGQCLFDNTTTFRGQCLFDNTTTFREQCIFNNTTQFKGECIFDNIILFNNECSFNRTVEFYQQCGFHYTTLFDSECIFGNIVRFNNLCEFNTTGFPNNPTTPAGYIEVSVNGQIRYIPYYI